MSNLLPSGDFPDSLRTVGYMATTPRSPQTALQGSRTASRGGEHELEVDQSFSRIVRFACVQLGVGAERSSEPKSRSTKACRCASRNAVGASRASSAALGQRASKRRCRDGRLNDRRGGWRSGNRVGRQGRGGRGGGRGR